MKILAFAATSSRNSINKQLVTHATDVLTSEILPNAEVEFLDLNDFEMPIYSIDRQNEDGIPVLAKEFFDKIGSADAILISYAEHNGFYTAAFKNIFDWASRIKMKVFQDKPMVIMSASIGPNGGEAFSNRQRTPRLSLGRMFLPDFRSVRLLKNLIRILAPSPIESSPQHCVNL